MGDDVMLGDKNAIAVEGYLYLYPLVTMEVTRRQMTNPAGTKPGFAPVGEFGHIRSFPDADFKAVVRPNFDTLYSSAWLDLTDGPVLVSVPDTAGRYYLLPILDMWTDVLASPGKRTTGTRAATFALVGPDWHGDLPADVTPIRATTPMVWVIGRTQTNGASDYDAVAAVQDGFVIARPSDAGGPGLAGEDEADLSIDMDMAPLDQVDALTGREFFTFAARLLKTHPPHATDWSTLARLRRIGLTVGESFDYDALGPEERAAVDAAPASGLERMKTSLPHMAPIVNGWQMNIQSMGVYGNFYLKRAIVAMVGLGANTPEDAVYPLAVADADGRPLDGAIDYVLHFAKEELPPVHAFWSVTMYDADGFQAANPIGRFAIGDRDDLVFGADGSLDLYLQHDNPGDERAPNWLPAPRGPLGVTMRLYAPASEVLVGGWNPPAIRRVNG